MKTISAGLQTHLNGEVTTLATCWKVTRRTGEVLGFTDQDQPLTLNADGLGNVTYAATSGYRRSAISSELGLSVDNVQLDALFDTDAITEADLALGLYDGATVLVFEVNWANLGQGVLKLQRGRLGKVTFHRGLYTAELEGLMQTYGQPIGELYTTDCRADLGDSRCQVDLTPPAWQAATAYAVGDRVIATGAAHPLRLFRCTTAGTSGGSEPTWDATVGNTTADNTVVWTTHLAFTISIEVDTVTAALSGEPGPHTFTITTDVSAFVPVPVDTEPFFHGGAIVWTGGDNIGLTSEVKTFIAASSTLGLYQAPPHAMQTGDTGTLTAGCVKRLAVCAGKFFNVVNFRGEPFIPGLNEALDYPSPGGRDNA